MIENSPTTRLTVIEYGGVACLIGLRAYASRELAHVI